MSWYTVYNVGRGNEPMPKSLKKKASDARFDAENTKQIKLKLNLRTDADILNKLYSTGNIQGYIKALIREDMKREGR